MPLDIVMFREYQGGKPEVIRESQRRRFKDPATVDEVIALDEAWRKGRGDLDMLKKEKGKVSKSVGMKKRAGENADAEIKRSKELEVQIKQAEVELVEAQQRTKRALNKIGNLVFGCDPEDKAEFGFVVVSKDEEKDNEVVKRWDGRKGFGKGEEGYDFRPPAVKQIRHHHELLSMIGGYEPERGVRVAGHRGYFMRDDGLALSMALQNYSITFLRSKGYSSLQPPYFMNKDVMAGVAQLEEFDEALYKVSGEGMDEKYLIATSEQPICGFHQGEWIEESTLPIRYAGLSTCFRKEAGAHGKDCWGIFRVHQFEKIEQFVLCKPEDSWAMHQKMLEYAEEFMQSLGLPYHVVNIVSGELNNAAAKKYDLEAFFPSFGPLTEETKHECFRELVSCSNCTDYQARSMEIRCGGKKMGQKEKRYVHMLNSTLCAVTRAICCILENYQTDTGVVVPEVLRPYMGGQDFIVFKDSEPTMPKPVSGSTKGGKPTKAAKAPAAKAPSVAAEESKSASSAAAVPADLQTKIDAQGAKVKATKEAMKAGKATKEDIAAEVAILKALKAEAGIDTRSDKEKKKAAKAAVKAAGKARAEKAAKKGGDGGGSGAGKKTAAKTKPADAKSAGKTKVAAPKVPKGAHGGPLTAGALSLFSKEGQDGLEAHLAAKSYLLGVEPSSEDQVVYSALVAATAGGAVGASKAAAGSGRKHTARWLNHIDSYDAKERADWPAPLEVLMCPRRSYLFDISRQ